MTVPPDPAYPIPPEYPGASATPPPPPPYPGASATPPPPPPPPPAYPGSTPPSPPPSYPGGRPPSPPHRPSPRTPPRTAPPPPPAAAEPPATGTHPHEMDFGGRGRVHIADRQRGTDATAWGQLLLHVPGFLISLILVTGVAYALLSSAGWLLVVVWIGSGALVFHPPAEGVFARRLLKLRYPTPAERARLEPVWHEVTARAGVEGRKYELWVEDSDELNALAAAGHIVGVTRFSLETLPSGQLAAVLAHELGHHTGGHAWSSLLGYWYGLPGRLAWAAVRAVARFALTLGARVSGCAALIVLGVLASLVLTFASRYGLILLLVLAAPYLLAAVGRRTELRADQHAAALGFAPMLVEVLGTMHTQELAARAATARAMSPYGPPAAAPEPALLTRLLVSHPDYHTRLHYLRPYLEPRP
ncbi:M48 family metalloprotease [Streptomyces polygonati]|uniref:M48 family metalloprotease n=1 Tax=Streptomyces polygonati TaxID=1617087 RepID=A0ABV8HLV2_9ACTN